MSECYVDFSEISEGAECVEFVQTRTVKARKAHVCTECSGPIAVGELHTYRAYKFEGDFNAERVCAPCGEAAAEFEFNVFGGALWKLFGEEWDNGARVQSCIARLSTAHAKAHMRAQWLKWDERRRVREIARARQLKRIRERQQAEPPKVSQ